MNIHFKSSPPIEIFTFFNKIDENFYKLLMVFLCVPGGLSEMSEFARFRAGVIN